MTDSGNWKLLSRLFLRHGEVTGTYRFRRDHHGISAVLFNDQVALRDRLGAISSTTHRGSTHPVCCVGKWPFYSTLASSHNHHRVDMCSKLHRSMDDGQASATPAYVLPTARPARPGATPVTKTTSAKPTVDLLNNFVSILPCR